LTFLLGLPFLLAALVYVLMWPDKAQKIAGWIWTGVSKVVRAADRSAVRLRVQGEVNDATADLFRDAPSDLLEGKLRIKWSDADEAQGFLRDGEVVVFMRRSDHHEENVAGALMAYLPQAVLPRARRYVGSDTMRAADMTIARNVLSGPIGTTGALDAFFDNHLDPACAADESFRSRVREVDEIDLHGWLTGILLPEYRRLGAQLSPGEPDDECIADAEAFARWLHGLAVREPEDNTYDLNYRGKNLRATIILVANWHKLNERGPDPYRKQAKRLIYSGEFDSVYMLARDDKIDPACEVAKQLEPDGRVVSVSIHKFALREDFKRRKLAKDHAVIIRIRPRSLAEGGPAKPDEDLDPPGTRLQPVEPTGEITASKSSASSLSDEAKDS
jgi:hypothetical protein